MRRCGALMNHNKTDYDMKKILVSILAALAFAGTLSAQEHDEDVLPSDRAHWTIRAALDVTIPGDWHIDGNSIKMFDPGTGVSIGASYMLPLTGKFYIEPGAHFYYDSYRYCNLVVDDGNYSESNPSVRKSGLRIPVMAGLRFDIFRTGSLGLFTGPQACIGFTSKLDFKDNALADDPYFSNNYKGIERRFDLAWNIGALMMLGHFQVDVTGSLGLLDLNKNAISFHEYRVSVGLGYIF